MNLELFFYWKSGGIGQRPHGPSPRGPAHRSMDRIKPGLSTLRPTVEIRSSKRVSDLLISSPIK
jgi:hypothetical protein